VKHSLRCLVPCSVWAERFTEAAAILDQLPEVWHLSYAPQVYVGTGAYAAAFGFLSRATAAQLAEDADASFIAILLVGWAMPLASDCNLLSVRAPAPPHLLAPVQFYAPLTLSRAQAGRLLAREYDKAREVPPNPPSPQVREMAGAMLALRLAYRRDGPVVPQSSYHATKNAERAFLPNELSH
jgi:hypothetical protein